MSIESDFRTVVIDKSGLASNKVFTSRANQTVTGTYAVIKKVSSVHYTSHDGRTSDKQSRFQVSIWGDSYKSVKDVAILTYGVADYTDSNIRFIRLDNEIDVVEKETERFGTHIDFLVQYN